MRILVAGVILGLFPAVVNADGFFLSKKGIYVREKQQHAFIEWEKGKEILHLTVKAEKHVGPAVWIVPIPSDPKAVEVEPSPTMPLVYSEFQTTRRAKESVNTALAMWFGMSSGLLPVGFATIGTNATSPFDTASKSMKAHADGVIVHSRVIKLGMVVEVITAESAQALDRYLQSKQIETDAKSITALEPYLEKEFTLVCGWPEDEKKPLEARSIRVEFPSDDIFYPLLPTSVYRGHIHTSIFVKGWVRPVDEIELPGLRCIYHNGGSFDLGIDQFISSRRNSPGSYQGNALEEHMKRTHAVPITEVRISNRPKDWTQDLRLAPGVPTNVALAALINRHKVSLFFLIPAIVGAALGLLLPFAFIPREKILGRDFGRGALVGAALGLTVFPAAILCIMWLRKREPMGSLERLHPAVWYLFGMLGAALLIPLGLGLLYLLELPLSMIEPMAGIAVIGLVLPIAVWPLAHAALRSAVKHRAGWFPVFVGGHYGVLLILGTAVNKFLG